MPRTRPPYLPEFRLEAVRMLRAGVRTPKQLAAELGCAEQTLRNWWRQDQADHGERDDVLSSEERQRLRELEGENKVLRQEREILKRAAAFFSLTVSLSLVLSGLAHFFAARPDPRLWSVSLSCCPLGAAARGRA